MDMGQKLISSLGFSAELSAPSSAPSAIKDGQLCNCLRVYVGVHLSEYPMSHLTGFNETLLLQLINVWSQPNQRWPPQKTDLREHKHCCNTY